MDDDDDIGPYKGWYIDWVEEWSQLWTDNNWDTYTPIKIEFRDDRIMGGIDFEVVFLGLGFRVRWNYMDTELSEDIRKQVSELTGGLDDDRS